MAAAEAAIANPLLDDTSMRGARGLLISITGGRDMTLFEVDEAANRIREEVDADANVIFGAIDDESLEGVIRVSVVATGIDREVSDVVQPSQPQIQRPTSSIRKNDPGTSHSSFHVQSSPLRSESMVEVIESLEIEKGKSTGEQFRPKSQIFCTACRSNDDAKCDKICCLWFKYCAGSDIKCSTYASEPYFSTNYGGSCEHGGYSACS